MPTSAGTVIPQKWPGDRFDVIWTFTLVPGSDPAQYTFGQIPQQLLSGVSGIRFVLFDERDVVRHPLVQSIISAYEGLDREREAASPRQTNGR